MNPPCKYCGCRLPTFRVKVETCGRCEAFVQDYKDAHDGAIPSAHELERFAAAVVAEVSPTVYRAFTYSHRLAVGAFDRRVGSFR